MAHWLFITDPDQWSWDQQKEEGMEGYPWQGTLEGEALTSAKRMQKDDLCLFYHGGGLKRFVGIVKVSKAFFPTEKHPDGTVEIAVVLSLINPVPDDMCRADKRLHNIGTLKNPEIPLQQVSREEWEAICEYGGLPYAP